MQAQSGLRSSARRLFLAGQKLEATGDWVGALQKYEQARQIYAGVDGPGRRASSRCAASCAPPAPPPSTRGASTKPPGGREEALKAYDKAIQWLPPDDPNRQVGADPGRAAEKND